MEWKVEERVRRGGRKVSMRISELMGKFEGGGGSEKEGTLVKLETGSNALCENEHFWKILLPEDILSSFSNTKSTYYSNHVEIQILIMENRNMSGIVICWTDSHQLNWQPIGSQGLESANEKNTMKVSVWNFLI